VEQAKAEPIALAPATETMSELAPEVVTEVKHRMRELVGEEAARGGYTITTTIDPDLQAAARRAVRSNLDRYAERHGLLAPIRAGVAARSKKKGGKAVTPFQGTPTAKGHHIYRAVVTGGDDEAGVLRVRVGTVDGVVRMRYAKRYNPKGLPPSQFAEEGSLLRVSAIAHRGVRGDGVPTEFRLELAPQSALVAIDVPSREVRALVGSYEAVRGGLDRATRARRQPGSTFKPFVYGYAIQSRSLTAASPVGEAPPEGSDEPPLFLRQALARSVNSAAVWTLKHVGPENVVAWARSAGIHSAMEPTESLALGAYEVTPAELATAYTTFASGGLYEEPTLILRIVGPDGAEVELPPTGHRRRAMEEADAYMITSLLTSVVEEGTGRKARDLGFEVAGKTGTTNDYRDAWFAGYSTRTVCVVWTGYDDAASLGQGEAGAKAALPAWIDFMKAAHARVPPAPFKRPRGVRAVQIDPASGLLPYDEQEETREELFLVGTEPTEIAEGPVVDDPYAEFEDELLEDVEVPGGPSTQPAAPESPTAKVEPVNEPPKAVDPSAPPPF
jgi:penicillin-binding protein 1A